MLTTGCQDKRTTITIQEIKTADEIARQDPLKSS